MTIDPEFKKALQQLPDKEKDKLVLRLLRKDKKLANKLYFELVATTSVEEQREKMEQRIIKRVGNATDTYYSPGYLLMDLRYLSGDINDHVSMTKDKYGEISLNCLMVRLALEQNNDKLNQAPPSKSHTFCTYVVARVFKILLLIQKQHEDVRLDFDEELEKIGNLIGQNHMLMDSAMNNGLDVNWLIQNNIPENIAQIHKDLRAGGYLR